MVVILTITWQESSLGVGWFNVVQIVCVALMGAQGEGPKAAIKSMQISNIFWLQIQKENSQVDVVCRCPC